MKKHKFTCGSLLLLCLALLPLLANALAPKPKYKNGTDVVKAMYKRWQGKWYPNFQFEQRAIFYKDGQVTKEEVWQELYSQPGLLHIRFGGFESGNGVVFAMDSVYHFKEHKLVANMPQVHPLVLLSFDVYFLKPEETVGKLNQLNFDLSKVYEADWQGRKAIVVGTTDPADGSSPQFWVDKERLYVLRVLTNNKGSVRDVEMNNYQQLENKWVATEIIFKTDGETTLREEYFNMSFPKSTNTSWFDPENFSNTRWQ
ncbi:outer membrane lipoprotein-sorting protein [Pontibacter litorisediminis]|uniref:outer membrane lipoprotein-sorting protein n=1 Tax=Pontibacter litorisediminis TaxID=1846260 RepID=UPI0023ED97E4|nr:outer membrane lipoprotein-sorting protein [Pontibacter litorisediminis]